MSAETARGFRDMEAAERIRDGYGWWYRHADGGYTTNNWEIRSMETGITLMKPVI